MRRRTKSNSVSLATAILVELGTVLAIIALAQPTWTRGVIERTIDMPSARRQSVLQQSPPASFNVDSNPWQQPTQPLNFETSRVAQAGNWQNLQSPSFDAAPVSPVYPPPSSTRDFPAWNSRY